MNPVAALLAAVCLVALAAPARADDMVQLLPGLMCESPDALAKLTLPDGSSRAAQNPSPQNLTLKAEGKCIDMGGEMSATLVKRRRNTSIVTADPGDGKGTRTFYVPNVDFSLDASNLAALRAASMPGAIPDSCYDDNAAVTLYGIIESALFTPEGKQPYRYRYLRFPAPVCVIQQAPYARIAILASLKGDARTTSIPDGTKVAVIGTIATIDAGEQPLTLQFLASRVILR